MNANQERLFELLALRAAEGLDAAEGAEAKDLLLRYPRVEEGGFERAAAAVHLALMGPEQPMPAGLSQKILADWDATRTPAGSVDAAASSFSSGRYGWWAAAAALLIAVVGWWPGPIEQSPIERPAELTADSPAPASPAELRARLLSAAETLDLPWAPTDDAAATGATGDVVWSGQEQVGFMRIAGLEANDPAVSQYQLWIFDRERDERYPVDGGVFDIPVGGAEALVAIDAKVRVGEPYLFAVTVEEPGGVVVSSRERIVLLAQS